MKYVVSRYNHDIDWLRDYTNDVVLYDRSPIPAPNSRKMANVGSDIYDKFSFIIDNYGSLPEVAVYTKANLFKYITKEEFDQIKDNKVFTPLLTQHHKTYSDDKGIVCYYKDEMYYERNDKWFLTAHPARSLELYDILGIADMEYIPFAPGSNYILPKENILNHSKEFYEKLRSYLEYTIYPGEAQIMERGLYTLWR